MSSIINDFLSNFGLSAGTAPTIIVGIVMIFIVIIALRLLLRMVDAVIRIGCIVLSIVFIAFVLYTFILGG